MLAKTNKTLEDLNKKYGIGGNTKPTSTKSDKTNTKITAGEDKVAKKENSQGKQNNSSAPTLEELNKKYGIGKKTSAKTDFSTQSVLGAFRRSWEAESGAYSSAPTGNKPTQKTTVAIDKQSNEYKRYSANEDFAEKSKYKSTEGEYKNWWDKINKGSYGLGYGDLTYEYINNTKGVRDKVESSARLYSSDSSNPFETGDSSMKDKGYDKLLPEEVAVYNYLYETEGKKQAQKYLDENEMTFQKRTYEELTAKWDENTDTVGGAILGSALSIPTNIVGAFPTLVDAAKDFVLGKEYNPYSPYKRGTNYTLDTRKYVGEDIEKATKGYEIAGQNIPSFLYSTGMSIADSAVGAATLGKYSALVMGTSAFHQKAKEMVEAGEDSNKVYATAFAAGVAEVLFEKVSIDRWLKIKDVGSVWRIVTSTLKQSGVEASEELATEISNILSDTIIRGETSEIAQMYKNLKSQGYSEEEVRTKIAQQIGSQVAWAGVGGAISGGFMGGGRSLSQYLGSKNGGQENNTAVKAEETEQQPTTEQDTLERAAMDVVANRNMAENEKTEPVSSATSTGDSLPIQARETTTTPLNAPVSTRNGVSLNERLEAQSQTNEPIAVEDVKVASGFGDNGAKLLIEMTSEEGMTFNKARDKVKVAYFSGYTGEDITFTNDLLNRAKLAGIDDRIADNNIALERAKNATVYDGAFTENEYTKNWSKSERRMVATVAKGLKMDISVVDKIIASVVNGRAYEANAEHYDGKMRISSTAEKVIYKLVMHEGGHRMSQLAPTEFGVLMDALYARAKRRATKLNLSGNLIFDNVKAEHDNAGIIMDTSDYLEEVAVRELETIFSSAREFNKWYAEISGNQQVRTNFEKFVDWVLDVIDEIKRALKQAKMSKAERTKANAELDRIKSLLANTYKASEKAATEIANAKRSTETTETKQADTTSGKTDRMKSVLGEGEKAVGIADGQAYVSNGKIFIPVNDVDAAKAEFGATASEKAGKSISKLLKQSSFAPINDNPVEGNLKGVGTVHVFTDVNGREIAVKKEVAEYLEGYNLEATFRGGKPYAIKATDNDGNIAGVAMAIGMNRSGQKYDIADDKRYLPKDSDYLKAVESGDMETAQAMVDEAAKRAGAETSNNGEVRHYYHGTNAKFNSFDVGKSSNGTYGFGFYFTRSKAMAKYFGETKEVYIMTDRIATRDQHTITAEQVSDFVNRYNLDLNKTILKYADSIKSWVESENDADIMKRLEQFVVERVSYDTETLLHDLTETFGYDGMRINGELVLWDKNLAKSADPVTYDDNGNVIPLSERFNQQSGDTRYSLKEDFSDTNSSKNLEIKTNEEYNGNKRYSLKWKTDLSPTQIKQVEKWLRQEGNPDEKRIADTAYWYKGRISGDDLFVIYSTQDATPTILYEVKGTNAKLEQNILLDLLEEEEYGKSINGKSSFTQRVSQGSWVQNVNNSQNNLGNLGSGQNNQNAGVLQRQSQRNGSRAFWNVIEDTFRKSEVKRYSLKGEDINKLSAEEKTVVESLGKGAEAITNNNGDMLIATNKNKNTVMYSLKTYQDGGKEALEKALRANGHTDAEIAETLSMVDDAADYLTILAAGYAKSHNYTALSNHLIADVITNVKTGKQVISSIVNNGEYPVNIDLALICKKRVAYMNLMNRLIEDGIFDKVNYGGEAIAKVNDLLRTDGFETACLGCFVESRRLQFQTWAETIVSEWNAEVDKRKSNAGNFSFADGKANLTDAEMDALADELKNAGKKNAQGNLNLGKGSVQTRMGRLLDKVPSLQKHLTVADLLTPNGLTALRAYDSNLFSIVKSRYGAASPKIVQDYNPYASEIAMMTFSSVKNITSNAVKGADAYRRKVINEMGGKPVKQKGENTKAFNERKAEFNAKVEDEAIRRYLYDIGGARIQSFSDFMIENVFDYIQIFADLSAKRLPLHGYTKEIVALRLFGMTGAKWNGSWIAHVDRNMGKEYAGLLPASEAKDGSAILVHTKDGDYAIGFDDYARYKATNKKTFIQSIGMKDMIALQLDHRYSPFVGSITIGVSDKQILAMLDSPLFRFVIPYHSSGMLPQFAKLVGVDLYNDYTDYQNTTVKQWYDAYGNPCEPISDVEVDTSYNFNAEVQKTGDAKKAADNYLKWCGQKHPVYGKNKKLVGYVTFKPKFSDSPYGTDFSKHENYYKLLEDFNSYDNITEESAVQGAVTMNFPSEQNRLTPSEMEAYKARLRETGIFSEKEIEKYSQIADKTFKELIADEVKGRAEYQKAQTPKWENTVKNVEEMLLSDHKRASHSLKGGMSATEFFDTIDDARKGKKKAVDKLAKYVDDGVMSTELYTELIEKYGAIHTGEKPSRDIQVPRKTEKGKKVSQTVRTILEAKATPDEAVPTIEKMVEDGIFSYDVYTDKQAIADSEAYIKEYGWDESLDDWFDAVEKGEVSKELTTMGWALYNNAANLAATTTSKTERTSAIKTSLKILDAMVRHQRSAAQALQATRILKKLSPETQLYGIQKSVSAFQNELVEKYGDKAPDLKIDEELAEQFINAKTPEERAAIEEEIYKDIGRQMPSRFIDKWNAWRYLAMLGNPRTHIRNIVGNAGFAPIVATKNLTATAIESIVYRVSGKKTVRGKALITGSKTDRALLKAAWGDYGNVADMISNGGKYNDSAMANQQIEEGRRIFKFKPLEGARKGNSKLLELEDMWFSKPHYAYALAQYCKAHNITAEQIQRGKAIAPAREYAIKEAQKATYRDTNAFSQFVSSLGRGGEIKHVPKVVSMVVEGILPFRKTPANILVRGVEYSPLGLLKGLSYDLYQVGKGKMSATEAIDNISAGLTGTGLLALGVYLAAQGLIRGHGEDEEEERKFKELTGHQAYSLELPNGQSITLDWLAPEALPLFVGVNLWETTKGTDEETNLSSILGAVSNISEPMLEMSCLQGLNDLFEGIGYASSNDTSGLVSVVSSAVTSYLTQGIPTLSGQIERTGEEERMTTYTEKNSFLTGDMQYTLGKASAKIPFWDYNQIPYIDAWGRQEASGSALKRGLNNFLNPAYTSTIETSSMENELLRLYESTGEGGVFPERADKYFTVDGVRKDLTADEYVRYATLKGQKSYNLVSDLVNSKAYKKLSNEEKVKAIKETYDYANQKAKQAISNYKPDKWVEKADEFGSKVGNYISFKTEVSGTKEENGGKISKQEVVDIILDMAQNDAETWNMYLSVYDAEKDVAIRNAGIGGEEYMNVLQNVDKYDEPNKNGKLGTYTNDEIATAIAMTDGLNKKERAILWQEITGSTSTKNNPWRSYLP